jgi:hypothetical protein
MTFPDDIPNKEKPPADCSFTSEHGSRPGSRETFADPDSAEKEASRMEQHGWIVPAILCLLLTAGSFYYYQQKIAQESSAELKAIRADASLRKAHLMALEEQTGLREQQLAISSNEGTSVECEE